jgi:hypothetical protein
MPSALQQDFLVSGQVEPELLVRGTLYTIRLRDDVERPRTFLVDLLEHAKDDLIGSVVLGRYNSEDDGTRVPYILFNQSENQILVSFGGSLGSTVNETGKVDQCTVCVSVPSSVCVMHQYSQLRPIRTADLNTQDIPREGRRLSYVAQPHLFRGSFDHVG